MKVEMMSLLSLKGSHCWQFNLLGRVNSSGHLTDPFLCPELNDHKIVA